MPRRSVPSSLRVYLFGQFRIEGGSGPIHLPTRKIEALLAYLILHPKPHGREKLAGLFWGEVTDKQARHSLRNALLILRKALAAEILLTDSEIAQLNPRYPLWVDACAFEQKIRTNPRSAIELYQGDLLCDFYDDWIAPLRERHRQLYHDTLLALAQQARAQSQYARAIELVQQVLASEPANERAYQQNVFCYAAMGNRTAALQEYEKCKRALQEELGVEPSRETQALYHWLLQAPTASREVPITNLPIPLSSFVGREREIAQVGQLLTRSRLVTLMGAGGSGKTRLAIQVATSLMGAFREGVRWVDLSSLTDEGLISHSVAQALGVRELTGEPLLETLSSYLYPREVLLVLDNCEHLVNACAQLAVSLLSAAPRVKILATSREALHISGESAWHLPTLSVPEAGPLPPVAELEQYEAIRLWTERAGAVKSDFALTPRNARAVAQICQRLDGIPLAIELAAARIKVLSAEQIAAHLDDRFHLLTDGSRTALPRHQTLRALIDWDYGLLSDKERTLLRRLSVFAGGWGLEAAESVASDESETVARSEILDLLGRLVDKSLVEAEERVGEARYRMLETLRQYAYEKLGQAGETRLFASRHLVYLADLAEKADSKMRGGEQLAWFDRVETEHDNVRAALAWAHEHDPRAGLKLSSSLGRFWLLRGHLSEGSDWTHRLLSRAGDCPLPMRAKALCRLA